MDAKHSQVASSHLLTTDCYLSWDNAFSHLPRFNLKDLAQKILTECIILFKFLFTLFIGTVNSIQVAKDRAVEGLVLTGSKFVLSILGQGNSGPVTKQLLKPFKPGESRLEGLQTKQTESGLYILSDAVRNN